MNPPHTLNPTTPVVVPVAVPVAVLVPTPMLARRVQPQPAKQPTTLETVAKVVDGVNQLVGFAKKFFDKPAVARAARPTQAARPNDYAQPEMLPDTAFDSDATGQGGGGDWAGEPMPTMDAPAASGWDWNQLLGIDPNAMTGGFDPAQMMGFDPSAMLGSVDPNAGW